MADTEKPDAQTDDPGAKATGRAASLNPGETVTPAEERSALEYLLGAPAPAMYKVSVNYETPAGMLPLTVHFRAMDGRKLDAIEQQNISKETGRMNKSDADVQLVVEAVTAIEDPKTGQKTDVKSEEFRTIKPDSPPLASSVDAINVRFGTQIGLVAGVANAIREAAGWGTDRVGKADRVLVRASGN